MMAARGTDQTHDRSNGEIRASAQSSEFENIASLPIERAFAALDSAPRGLDDGEARRRLTQHGPNEPVMRRADPLAAQVLRRFSNPLVLILMFASIISAFTRDFANATIILAIVVFSVAIDIVQTRRSARAAEALKARIAQTATVLRNGVQREVPRREIVPGDVVRLTAGDMVPADARLIASNDLHVNEAALTGESFPVEKATGRADACTLLMGSSVVSGMGTALVFGTGPHTAFGDIAQQLARRPPPTEFERGIARFGTFILKTVVFLVLFVFVVTAVRGRDPLESLLFAVALAVGLTPEGLPMITTLTLTKGALRMARVKVIVKNLAAIQNFGSIDVLCSDKTGTLTTGSMRFDVHIDPLGATSDRSLLLAYVNSQFQTGVDNPLDAAVLRHDRPDISGFEKVDEIPFDFERRRLSVVVRRGEEVLLVTKGAPEDVLAVSTGYEVDGKTAILDQEARSRIADTYEALGRKGYRVLGVASARLPLRPSYSKEDEHDLVLAGFVAFVDPPRPDAADTLLALRRQGVHVRVLTGDSEQVAAHVCEKVGIPTKHMLTGSEIDAMSDPALAHRAERTPVFARVSPAQKTRILHALRARGHVVGFLGDGINDSPSLHAADVGISVANAVDVAKDAAEIILLEPDLRVLLDGVMEGRRAFGNVMKYLLMGTSSNFGNMLSMAGAAVVLPFLPMLPTQILLNNVLYDLAQFTIPTDRVDETLVRKPRRWDIDAIRRVMVFIGPISSVYDFLTFYVLLHLFHANEALFHTGWFVESLATQTLVIFVIRTAGPALKSRPSAPLATTTIAVVLFALALPFTELGRLFGFVPLQASFFLFLAIATGTYLVLVEIAKRILFSKVFAASRPSVDHEHGGKPRVVLEA
ncbi:MAG TPA: magnesium-translocating P-type ATPase [Polyangiaceae bacterium]|nr:magnesium-translocating P-type ATPase [Polyangiaceae bacterium]